MPIVPLDLVNWNEFCVDYAGFEKYLDKIKIYLAKEPEWAIDSLPSLQMKRCDHNACFIVEADLKVGQQFKFVVTGLTEAEAREVFDARVKAKVPNTVRFDYDKEKQTFWLLDQVRPYVNNKGWNRNSVFCKNFWLDP